MLREFHESGTFTRSLNTTVLVLITKKGGAEDLCDLLACWEVFINYWQRCWQIG